MKLRRITPACAWLLVAGLTVSWSAAQDKTPRPTKIDKKLEKQLKEDLLGGLDDIPSQVKPRKTDPQQAGEDIRLGPQKESPFLALGRRMREAEERIALGDTGRNTQTLQKDILARLDAMIDQTCKKCSGGSSARKSSKKSPGKSGQGKGKGNAAAQGPQRSTDRVEQGKAKDAQLTDLKKTMYRVWGHLPPQVQKQMRAAAEERFLPKYRRLIELYYKRLAEDLSSDR